MKTLELNQMETVQGGDAICAASRASVAWTFGVFALITIASGGLGLAVLAGANFVGAMLVEGEACH